MNESQPKKFYIDRMKVRRMMRRRGYVYFRELAEAVGIHPLSMIRRMTRDNVGVFRNDFVERLADALGCNPLDLVSTVGYPPPVLPPDPLIPWPPPYRRGRLPTRLEEPDAETAKTTTEEGEWR
jgi:DNA-binding Xre family transcriptional regulator